MFSGLTSSSRLALASLSALSLPMIPIWLGIQHRVTCFLFLSSRVCFMRNFWISVLVISSFSMACIQESESVKMMNFFRLESWIILSASISATASAEKILLSSGSRVGNVPKAQVAADPTFSSFLEPSVYTCVWLMWLSTTSLNRALYWWVLEQKMDGKIFRRAEN